MSFGAPWGLLALAVIPPLIAAYFLRRRQPPRTVSALFLWKTPDQQAEAGPRLQRFSRERSLLLELLAVLFATLFLADVRCGAEQRRTHLVVVLDGSFSMQAVTGGASTLERVRESLRELSGREGAGVLTLVVSGVKPTVVAGPQLELGPALAKLDDWKPSQPAHDVTPALTLAHELAGAAGTRVVLLTDGPPPAGFVAPPWLEAHALAKPAENVGFVAAQRRDQGGVAQLTVRVAAFTTTAKEVAVTVHCPGVADQVQQVTIPAGGTTALRASLGCTQAIEVSLPADALAFDNRLTLLPVPLADVTVELAPELEGAARNALTRFFSVAPGVKLDSPGTLIIGAATSGARVRLGAVEPLRSFVGPFFTQKGHPLFDDVQLGGVVWTAGANPTGRPLLSAGETVLVSEEDDGTLHLNLELGRSNIQRTAAWPIFLGNLVHESRANVPGFPRKQLMLGEDVTVVTTPGARWELVDGHGDRRAVPATGVVTMPALPTIGVWTLERDGTQLDAVTVLPIDPHESDLRGLGAWESIPETPALAGLVGETPRSWWPLWVVLALVLLNLWWTAGARSRTGAAS